MITDLNTTDICFSWFWRLEMWDQNANMVDSGEILFWVEDSWLPAVSSHGGKGARKFSGAHYIRVLIPFMTVPPSRPNYLPKVPLPNIITLGVRISSYEFWGGDTNIQSIAMIIWIIKYMSSSLPPSPFPSVTLQLILSECLPCASHCSGWRCKTDKFCLHWDHILVEKTVSSTINKQMYNVLWSNSRCY